MVNWGKLIFGGVDSSDYGIYITGEGVYNAPERAVEFVDVPGRNGAIALDQGRFNNITITYPAGTFGKTQEEFREAVSDFRNAVMALRGYQKLEDTYHPNEYRMAVYTAGLEVSPVHYGTAGEFEVTFECKPQRWLKCGDYPVPIESGNVLTNPSQFESSPVLLSQGYGMINFNGFSIGLENQPMGLIEMPQAVFSLESTGSGFSRAISFDQYRLEPDDRIYMVYNWTGFKTALTFVPTDEVSNVAVGTLSSNLGQSDFRHFANSDGSYYIEFSGYPLNDVEFLKGTTSYLEYTAPLTFDVGSTSHSFTAKMTMYYDGDAEITVSVRLVQNSAGSLSISSNYFAFHAYRWYADSTFPTWHQDFEYIVIDCDLGEAYAVEGENYVPLNQWVNFGSDLPTLAPGQNKITADNTITDLKIKPRWWKI